MTFSIGRYFTRGTAGVKYVDKPERRCYSANTIVRRGVNIPRDNGSSPVGKVSLKPPSGLVSQIPLRKRVEQVTQIITEQSFTNFSPSCCPTGHCPSSAPLPPPHLALAPRQKQETFPPRRTPLLPRSVPVKLEPF